MLTNIAELVQKLPMIHFLSHQTFSKIFVEENSRNPNIVLIRLSAKVLLEIVRFRFPMHLTFEDFTVPEK